MRSRFTIVILLILATVAVYWPVYGFGFVWDDSVFLYENGYMNPPGIRNALHYWTDPKWLYMPLTYTVWSFLAWLSQYMPAEPYGLNPALFHTVNLVVHLLSVFTLLSILRMLLTYGFRNDVGVGESSDDSFKIDIAAGAGAFIFALHPVQVESVAWASELKDLLSGLFSFLAVREYLLFAFISSGTRAGGNKNRHYLLACGAFLLALSSKPAAVIVPLVVLILDRYAVKRSFKKIAYSLTGWFILAAIFAIVAKSVQQSEEALPMIGLWPRPFIAGDALAFYLYKLIWPFELAIDYGRNPEYALTQWWIYVTWLFPATLVAATFLLKKRIPFFVSLGVFAVSLLPVLGFIKFIFQTTSTVADHYLYFSMLGISLLVSLAVFRTPTKFVWPLCTVIIVLFGLRSSYQLEVWRDSVSLNRHAIKVNPSSYIGHINLGLALTKQKRVDEAVLYFKKAVNMKANPAAAYYGMGNALQTKGELDNAISSYKKALTYAPGYAKAHNNLAMVLVAKGNAAEAVKHYRDALKIQPEEAKIYNNLGAAMDIQGKIREAASNYKKAIMIKPGMAEAHYNLGLAMKKMGKLDEAAASFAEALKINPSFQMAEKQLEAIGAARYPGR